MSTGFPFPGWVLFDGGPLRLFGAVAILGVLVVFGVLAMRALRDGRTRQADWHCPLDGRPATTVYRVGTTFGAARVLRCSLLGAHHACSQRCLRAA